MGNLKYKFKHAQKAERSVINLDFDKLQYCKLRALLDRFRRSWKKLISGSDIALGIMSRNISKVDILPFY